jgi:hypothetical protein
MQANTKLSDYDKEILKELKEILKDVQVLNLNDETTIAFKPLGNTVEFALSVMAPTEKKFRRKVGEFYALQKFYDNETVKMAKEDFMRMTEWVWDAYPMVE